MWDYIVVGGGSAGCVLAARLSENPRHRVLLLEAGAGGKERLPLVTAPGGTLYLAMNRFFDWRYRMEPDSTCNGRVEELNGGKLLGGGSSINGMMFIRGNCEDYEEWARLGNCGWSYRDVLPYFRKIERTDIGSEEYHGREGPLRVDYASPLLDISHRFIEAAVESGISYNSDINGEYQDGVSRTPCSASRGVRQSTARVYLHPAMRRANLKVITGAHAQRVLIEGRRATGVQFRHWGKTRTELASKEVILTAGAVRSPQILMLSGVGPAEQLRKFDIPIIVDRSGVGQNHMEHAAAGVVYEVSLPTWHADLRWNRKIRHGLNWLLRREGPASSGYSQAVAFIRSRPHLSRPDIQLSLIPVAISFKHNRKCIDTSRNMIKVLVNACQPSGRGHLELASADAAVPPRIFPRLLGGEDDVDAMTRGVEITRRIFEMGALKPFVTRQISPGAIVDTRAELESWLRTVTVDTVHPSGTCKMGQDENAVVDERLRVRGIQNLRVADASIMPTITSGNTNAPVIMIAEKAAALILKDLETHVGASV